jgi:adenylate cyclase
VDKFMGDGIMAIYNAPLSQPDHALRAVKTALDMQTELEQYHQQAGIAVPKVTYGIGINTGEAVVGNLGTADLMNYTVIGDAVNTSRRLQESAQGGQILLSGSTYEQVRKFVTVEELEPVHLKGKSGPVPVFNLVGMRSTWA